MVYSNITTNSILHEFEDSHLSNVFYSDPEVNELNIPAQLNDYLYEKNLIVFIMDTAKKLKICEGNKMFELIVGEVLEAQLHTIQKA